MARAERRKVAGPGVHQLQVDTDNPNDKLDAVADAEAAVETLEVGMNGVLGDAKVKSDPILGLIVERRTHKLHLAGRKPQAALDGGPALVIKQQGLQRRISDRRDRSDHPFRVSPAEFSTPKISVGNHGRNLSRLRPCGQLNPPLPSGLPFLPTNQLTG